MVAKKDLIKLLQEHDGRVSYAEAVQAFGGEADLFEVLNGLEMNRDVVVIDNPATQGPEMICLASIDEDELAPVGSHSRSFHN